MGSDVSVNRDDADSDVSVDRTEKNEAEAPVFEYAEGMAPDIMYQSKEPEELPEPEKTTEELQEELQNDLKQRALKAMNKKKFEKLKAKVQAVESSSDEDEESSEDEKMETETAEKEPEAPKKGEKFRSGYGSD